MDEELAFHIEMRARELIERGESPARARELALQRFGDYGASRGECLTINERQGRRMKRTDYLTELRRDIAYALRSLRRQPGFALVAILTLAIGIGANSAIFSVVNGVLLRSLPYPEAERLYRVEMIYPDGKRYSSLSAPDFMSVAESSRAFEAVVGYDAMILTATGPGEPKEFVSALVSQGLFEALGMPLALGRGFSAEEHQPGRNQYLVLDHGFWQREFGGEASALGRTLLIRGEQFTVVGVLAAGATLPFRAELYVPLDYDDTFSATTAAGRRSEFLQVLARARPGVTAAQADADMNRVAALLAAEFPETNERLQMAAQPLRDVIVGDVRGPLLVLLGAVGFVLLVACANVANLLLARASSRQGELAVRAALGAGRGRLVRQLITESLVLGLAGGALGLLIAYAGTQALIAAQPADIPRLDGIGIDRTVVLATLGLSLLTGLLFGVVPAAQATAGGLSTTIREGGRGLAGGGQRLRGALIVAEMALAVMLLVGAGLLIRSFTELTRVDPGFRTDRGMSLTLRMPSDVYPTGAALRTFVEDFLARVGTVPGVAGAAGTTVLPLSGLGPILSFEVVGAPLPPENVNREIAVASVTPGYFEAIGARVVRGRGANEYDRSDSPPVAMINEAGVRRWFPDGSDPIGQRVSLGTEREIVGVVSDVLQSNPGTPAEPQLFIPYTQNTSRTLRVVVRTAGDPLAVAPAIRGLLREADPGMPISDFVPFEQIVSASVARPRFYTSLLALFAGVALLLAAIGIFGVMSYTVAQRAREISIRMALGARRGSVIAMIVGRSMALAGLGLAFGIAGSLFAVRVIRSQLYNVTAGDPYTIGAVVLVLAGSALAASYLPARRAAALEPGLALRS